MLSIRKIGAFGRTYRHLNRYRQILGILIKHGFGEFIERLNIEQYIEIGLKVFTSVKPSATNASKHGRATRVRMALEELGATYIKLGQLLSTRTDLMPVSFIDEFARLQDKVPPFSMSSVEEVFKAEFGQLPETLFEWFDQTPLASASIGQVHKARLATGEAVAVKVQRPGIQKVVEVDLEILLHLAMLAENNIEEMALLRPIKIVEEFTRKVEKELDYGNEAANMERFARQFFDEDTLHVPQVYPELSTRRVLVMEFIDGVKISDVKALETAGLDKKKIVQRGADLMLAQVFDHGFFHADPHPGNISVLPGNIICLLDFGMMGSVDRYTKKHFVDLIYSVVKGDAPMTTQALLKLTSWEEEPEMRLLERDVDDMMGRYLNKPLKHISIGRLLEDLLAVTSRYHLRIPPDIFLMLKALAAVEGIALLLDPDFDMVAQSAPFVRREKMARFHPKRMAEDATVLVADFLEFMRDFPREALELVQQIKRQKLTVKFEHHGLEKLIETHDRISNKLSLAIMIAALIIGSSIVVIAKIPPMIYGIPLIGIIIFIAAALMGLWLIVEIVRTRRF